jgi:conjugal transfer ATP-binding protein TraC
MSVLESLADVLKRDKIDQYLTATACLDDVIFFEEEGAIGSCLSIKLLSGAGVSTQIALNTLLNDQYPTGTIMQVINFGSPDLSEVIADYKNMRQPHHGDISCENAQKAVLKRADFIEKGARRKIIPSSEARIVNSMGYWTIKVPLKVKVSGSASNDDSVKLEKEIEEFKILVERLMSQLSVAGIESRTMTPSEYKALLVRYCDPYGPVDAVLRDDVPIYEQVMPIGARLNWRNKFSQFLNFKGFAQQHRDSRMNACILSVDRYPRVHALSGMFSMLGDPRGSGPQIGVPYALCTTIHYPDSLKKENSIRKGQIFTDKQATGPMLRWSPMLRAKNEGFQIMSKSLADGDSPVEVCTTLCIYNRSRSELNRISTRMASYYKTLGWTMRPERFITGVTFFNQLPLSPSPESIQQTHRFKTMGGVHAAQLIPIIDEWRGYGSATLLSTRRGRVFGVDLWHPQNKNRNFLVVAEAGAGKSYLVQRLVQDNRSLDVKTWIIDSGSSHTKMAIASGGQVISFHRDSKICLNPFSNVVEIDDELPILVSLLAKMVQARGEIDTPDYVRLMEAVKSVYSSMGTRMEIGDVISYLNEQTGDRDPTNRCQELARSLGPFGPTGPYGSWFKGANNFRADAGLTVLELSDLGTNEVLQDVVLMQLVITIKQSMYLARDGKPKMLIVEEGGDRMKDPAFAKFLAEAYAKVRKEVGSIGLVVQNLDQLFKNNNYGSTIAANADTRFILSQKDETITAAMANRWMELDAYQEQCIRSLNTVKGQYSEIAVITSMGTGVARLVEAPFNRILFSSEGPEFHGILTAAQQGKDIIPMIEALAKPIEDQEARSFN